MTFDVDAYFRNANTWLFMLAFAILPLPDLVTAVIKEAGKKKAESLRDKLSALKEPAVISAGILFFTVISLRGLIPYGFAILDDSESSSAEITGVIESVEDSDPHLPFKFNYDGKTYFGNEITIDAIKYLAVTAGPYQTGDTVTVEYLPKSHCVISILGDRLPEQAAQVPDTQPVVTAGNATVPRTLILLEAAVLVLIDTFLIVSMRKNLYRFLTDAENSKIARTIYERQSPGARVFLGFIRPYVKNGAEDFRVRHRLYLAEILTLIPQYAYILIYSITHGKESGLGVFCAAGVAVFLKSMAFITSKRDEEAPGMLKYDPEMRMPFEGSFSGFAGRRK